MVLPANLKSPVRWLSARLANGTLAGYRIGRTWRMTHEDVEDLITRHRNGAQRIPIRPQTSNPTPALPEPERPPNGLSPRSWMLRQRSEIPGTALHARKYGIRTEVAPRPDGMPPPGYKHVHPESEAVIFNMPPLSDVQQALLDRVRRERTVIVDGSAKRTVESLVRRNLVTYEVAYVMNANQDATHLPVHRAPQGQDMKARRTSSSFSAQNLDALGGAVRWLTAVEAAEHAKVSSATIRDAVKRGELPAYAVGRSGRQYRLRAQDVDEWMMSRAYEPP